MKVEVERAESPIETVTITMTKDEAEVLAALSYFHESGESPRLVNSRLRVSNGTGKGSLIFDALPEEIQKAVTNE